MTKGHHTPAPWEKLHGGIIRGQGIDICEVYSAHDRDFEAEANGHLIEAAPDLLEVAKETAQEPCSTKGLEDMEGGCCKSCRARAAVAKATGGKSC